MSRSGRPRRRTASPAPSLSGAMPIPTVLEALVRPDLWGRWFGAASWAAWHVVLAAIAGLPLPEDGEALYCRCTGRTRYVAQRVPEAWLIIGRRGGKSLAAAFLAAYHVLRLSLLLASRGLVVAPGEVLTIVLIAVDRKQARVVFRYLVALVDVVPALAALVARRTREALVFSNGIVVEIHTASFRTTRGYTMPVVIIDEGAYLRDETSATPDTEILAALRPAMATVPGALLIVISSPYARRGEVWQAHRRHYAQDGDPVLVWQPDTATMNPTVDARIIAEAYERDPVAAAADWGAQFRTDVETFLTREAVEGCVVEGRRVLPPDSSAGYVAFCDPSGGSQDSMTLAIAHPEVRGARVVAVLDCLYERRPPFSPDATVQECAELLAHYGITATWGDRYGGAWPGERFGGHGIGYEPCGTPKEDLYRELVPLVHSGRVELLDDARLVTQLVTLERRTGRGGRDSIVKAPSTHDDLANAAAGALVQAHALGIATPASAMTVAEFRRLKRFAAETGIAVITDQVPPGVAISDPSGDEYIPRDAEEAVAIMDPWEREEKIRHFLEQW